MNKFIFWVLFQELDEAREITNRRLQERNARLNLIEAQLQQPHQQKQEQQQQTHQQQEEEQQLPHDSQQWQQQQQPHEQEEQEQQHPHDSQQKQQEQTHEQQQQQQLQSHKQQQQQQQQSHEQQQQQQELQIPPELRKSTKLFRTPPLSRKSLRAQTPSQKKKDYDESH